MKSWIVAASSALFIAGCGGATEGNNVAAANATESPANATTASNTSAPAPAAGATNVAIGRWVQQSGDCDLATDVEFTATQVRMHGGANGETLDLPMTYSNMTTTSVSMQVEPGQPTTVATLRDSTHLELVREDRPQQICTMVRR